MLADQTKVSPWITADPSVIGLFLRQPPDRGRRKQGRHRHSVGDDNVSRCGAPSLHKTRETSVGLEELQHLFLHNRPTVHLLDILRATKSSAVWSVHA